MAWNTANDAVLAEGKRVLIDDPAGSTAWPWSASTSTCGVTPARATSTSLTERALEDITRMIAEHRLDSVAISFLWSFAKVRHERALTEALVVAAPEVFVSSSAAVSPRLGEYERTVATEPPGTGTGTGNGEGAAGHALESEEVLRDVVSGALLRDHFDDAGPRHPSLPNGSVPWPARRGRSKQPRRTGTGRVGDPAQWRRPCLRISGMTSSPNSSSSLA